MNDDELGRNVIAVIKLAYNKGFQDGRRSLGKKKSRRRAFTTKTKQAVLLFQGFRCRSCNCILVVPEFDHIDGNKANNLSTNCQALCPNCHRIKTRRSKLSSNLLRFKPIK